MQCLPQSRLQGGRDNNCRNKAFEHEEERKPQSKVEALAWWGRECGRVSISLVEYEGTGRNVKDRRGVRCETVLLESGKMKTPGKLNEFMGWHWICNWGWWSLNQNKNRVNAVMGYFPALSSCSREDIEEVENWTQSRFQVCWKSKPLGRRPTKFMARAGGDYSDGPGALTWAGREMRIW